MFSSKIFIGILSVLIVSASAVGFLFLQKSAEKQKPLTETAQKTKISPEPSLAWIEIKKSKVFELFPDGKTKRELKTGDAILSGMTISSDSNGSAIIHFPDGSVARLEPETKLTIDETKFESSDGTLIMRINLTAGKVWSKILQLTTPQSIWEIKTANAVATVRGTSFGISFTKEKTSVIGLENKVAVKPRDPKTGEIIAIKEAIVEPEKFATISNQEIEKIKETKEIKIISIAAAPTEVKSEIQEWVKINKAEDAEFEQIIKEIKEQKIENKIEDEEFRLKIQEKILENIEIEKPSIEDNQPRQEELKEPMPIQTQTSAPAENNNNIVSVKIIGSFKTSVIEGEIIQFQALATTADGKQLDITAKASWQVVGNIGTIAIGKFQAQLAGEIAEQGFGLGNIIAVWKDPLTGKEIFGASNIIKVEAAPIENQEQLEG